jgi:hypothetical protein
MISAYVVAARLACHLDAVASEVVGYALPATGTAIQRRMGPNVFACSGVSIAITNVQTAPTPPNCDPWAQYAVAAGIARTCVVEFNKYGQTLNPEADIIAQTMSLDSAVLWQAFFHRAPLTVFEITGGLGITTATFTVGEFDVPQCAYPETTAVVLS